MSDTPNTEQLPAVQQRREYAVVHSEAALFDSATYEHLMRVAEASYQASFLPDHLRHDANSNALQPNAVRANCFIVATYAHDFRTSFMAVAQSISIVRGKAMFEGKFIAAMVERKIGTRLRKEYFGQPGTDSYGVRIFTDQDAAQGFEPIEGTVGEWATNERSGARKEMWRHPNKQKNQLFYMGARVWARLNMPGIMLGIIGDDEVDDVQPIDMAPAPVERITAGFASAAKVDDKTPLAGELVQQDPQTPAAPTDSAPAQVGEKIETASDKATTEDPPPPEKQKASRVRDRKAPKEAGVSEQLRKAFDAANETLRTLAGECFQRGLEQPGTISIEDARDDEHAQEMLGAANRIIDRVKAGIARHDEEQAARKAAAASAANDQPPAGASDHSEREQASIESRAAHQKPTPDQVLKSLEDAWRPVETWAKLKESFNGFARLEDWRMLTPADRNRVYALVWRLASAINAGCLERGDPYECDPAQDATAYRCAIEECDDAGVIEHMWAQITESPSWKGQSDKVRDSVAAATMARLAHLRG